MQGRPITIYRALNGVWDGDQGPQSQGGGSVAPTALGTSPVQSGPMALLPQPSQPCKADVAQPEDPGLSEGHSALRTSLEVGVDFVSAHVTLGSFLVLLKWTPHLGTPRTALPVQGELADSNATLRLDLVCKSLRVSAAPSASVSNWLPLRSELFFLCNFLSGRRELAPSKETGYLVSEVLIFQISGSLKKATLSSSLRPWAAHLGGCCPPLLRPSRSSTRELGWA